MLRLFYFILLLPISWLLLQVLIVPELIVPELLLTSKQPVIIAIAIPTTIKEIPTAISTKELTTSTVAVARVLVIFDMV